MSRYTGPACKLCRREGVKLFLKGDRCFTGKCAVTRRNSAPGQHGTRRKKVGEYGLQLREKQKTRRYYGVQEKQFKKYFVMAEKKTEGQTGENLLELLERRFDNIIYRIGLGESRRESRQLVKHGHFLINGKKVDIPSVICKVGDIITLKEKSRSLPKFKYLIEGIDNKLVPKWIDADKTNIVAKIIAKPTKEDIDLELTESLIVELYSK